MVRWVPLVQAVPVGLLAGYVFWRHNVEPSTLTAAMVATWVLGSVAFHASLLFGAVLAGVAFLFFRRAHERC